MGLFDHLFKSKAPAGEEKVVEHAVEAGAKPAEGAPRTPVPQKADPSAFLHPKSFVPRGAPGLTPAPRPASSGISKPTVERKPVATTPPAADEIILTLGDVLSRIPTEYLKSGTHDPKRELRFKINDLSSDIARGRAAVPLSRIAQLAPEIFTKQVGANEDMEIRLPLQKLVEQIGLLRSRPKTTAIVEKVTVVEKMARPATAADAPPAEKPVVPIEVKVEPKRVEPVATPHTPPVVVRAGTERVVRVMPPPPKVPSIVLPEPAPAPKPVELKLAAEQAAEAPIVLGPPPAVEPSPAMAKTPPPIDIPAISVVPVPPPPTPALVPVPEPTPTVVEAKEIAKLVEPAPQVPETQQAAIPIEPVVSAAPVAPVPETAPPVAAEPVTPPVVPVAAVPPPLPVEPVISAPEPVAAIPPAPVIPPRASVVPPKVSVVPPPPPPPPASESQKIVIDWGTVIPEKVEEKPEANVPEVESETPSAEPVVSESVITEPPAREPVVPAPAAEELKLAAAEPVVTAPVVEKPVIAKPVAEEPAIAEPVVTAPAAEGPKLAPIESPDIDPDEEKIHLSLAAILKHCPREILVGELPQVDDSVRITLPFAPIDRQLVKGHVEISALRFIVALPEVYHKFFVAKIGVKVPIPLEEVFQNLPSPKQELTPVNPTPPPVVLAPAAPAAPVIPVAPAAEISRVLEAEELGVLRVPPIVPLAPTAREVDEKPEEAPVPVEAKQVEPPVPVSPVAPPPLPVVKPKEPIEVEVPVVPAAAAPAEEVALAAVVEPISPVVELPERLTAEQAAQPPVPTAADITPAPVEPPPILTVASAVPETPPAAPSPEPTPAPPLIPLGAANAAPTGNEPPKLVLQPPMFRPQIIPPPRIFGFAPPPVTPEAEQPAKVEPPSVLAGLTETPAPAPAPAAEDAVPRSVALPVEVAAAKEAVVGKPEPEVVAAEAIAIPGGHVAVSELPKVEEPAATPSDSVPSAELIALAGEHEAPDIAHFSDELVPFADLAESLAHETTYAPALAEVVHVDGPAGESVEPKAPVVPDAEAPTAEAAQPEKATADEEHRAVPIVEGLAVAAVAATIAEHVPLNFRDEVPPAEHKAEEEVAAQHEVTVEAPIATEKAVEVLSEVPPSSEEPVAKVSEEEADSSEPEPSEESPKAAETPASPAPEPPAAAVPPPPPPHPLFPLPKITPSTPVHVEVLPPPSLPLRRFDQDAVQALFMTEETLDLPKISRLAAALPGVYACVIATRDQACTGGTLPEGFDLAALLGLAPRVGEAAGRMPIGQLKHFTLYGDAYSVSFFERNGLSLCAVHRPRSFVPGVREKLVALADELSR